MTNPEAFSGASVDNRRGRAEDRRMADRFVSMEKDIATLTADVANIRANYATKADLAKLESTMYEGINAQTWKLVTWITSAMALMTTAVYFIARNVH
jgi:hypothetical protein